MATIPEQYRMTRAGLQSSQVELSRRSGVALATIAAVEKGLRKTYPRTVRGLEAALEAARVEFVNGGASVSQDPGS